MKVSFEDSGLPTLLPVKAAASDWEHLVASFQDLVAVVGVDGLQKEGWRLDS